MGACLEYLQFVGSNVGVNFTEKDGESLRLEFNPEIGLGACSRADSTYENGPFNFLLGMDAARWGEGLWQFGGSAGLRYNANRRIFYNVDAVVKGGVIFREGGLEGAALSPALRIGVGWNALAMEAGFVVLGGGANLETGDRYAMLRLAFPFYNLADAVSQLAESSEKKSGGESREGSTRSANR
ncbi:MAG: hypothetical protein K8R69_12080 [Deltaproteobacteria bacterium]|nr:hypothetical protein [Deltaproteobacteria bacterium]